MSADKMPPLPETTLAEVRNNFLKESRLSETGAAYWGRNWHEVRKFYTADQMHAYARAYAAEQTRELVEALQVLLDGSQHCGEMQWCGMDDLSPWEKTRALIAKHKEQP
jgi:hypothetical protein